MDGSYGRDLLKAFGVIAVALSSGIVTTVCVAKILFKLAFR